MFFTENKGSFLSVTEWVMYVFIALYPFVLYMGHLYYGTTTRAVNLVVTAGILAILFGVKLIKSRERIAVIKSPVTLGLSCLLLVFFVSGLVGADFSSTFWSKATRMTGLFYFLHLGMYYFFLTMIFKENEKMITFLKIFVASAVIFSLGALLGRDGYNVIFTQKPWDGFTFGNSSFAAMYLYAGFMASIFLVFRVVKSERKWWHYGVPALIILNPYTLSKGFLTGKVNIFSEPSLVVGEAQATSVVFFTSIAMLFVLWLVFRIKNSITRNKVLAGGVIGGVVFFALALYSFLVPGGVLQKAYLSQASPARPIVWELSKDAINEKPMFGWGGDNFDRAFEAHYDNSLLEKKNGNEPWFDRAHNILIDQTVETGYIGTSLYVLVFLIVIYAMVYVLRKSNSREDKVLASVLLVYFVGHFMELQTAFDTTISYVPFTVMTALSTIVYYRTQNAISKNSNSIVLSGNFQKILGGGIVLVFGILLFVGTFPIINAQTSNGLIRTVGSAEKRITYYDSLFGSPVDKGAFIWRTSADFQRGITQSPKVLEDPKKVEGLKIEMDMLTKYYEEYLESNPENYRVKINLASAYIYQKLFEVDNLDKAHKVLDEALLVVPQAPQAYWMKSVAYLYQQKFDLAREWAQKGVAVNPNIEQSQKIVDYIERSIKTFPEITLYMFWQS